MNSKYLGVNISWYQFLI